jgi:cytochrome c551/c552
MRTLRFILPASIALAGLLLPAVIVQGKPEYAKTEKKSCVFCHVAAGKPELNDAGNYYKEKHSLEGYKPKS